MPPASWSFCVCVWSLVACFVSADSATRFAPQSPKKFKTNSIVALRLSNSGAELSPSNGNSLHLDEFSPSGAKLQTLKGPVGCTLGSAARLSGYHYSGRVTRSVDKQLVSYTCVGAGVNAPVADATRNIVTVASDGKFSTPLSTGITGAGAFASMKITNTATSGYYHGGDSPNGLYYLPAEGGSSVTLQSAYDITALAIFEGSLCKYKISLL